MDEKSADGRSRELDSYVYFKHGTIDMQYTQEDQQAGFILPKQYFLSAENTIDHLSEAFEDRTHLPVDLAGAVFLIQSNLLPTLKKQLAAEMQVPEDDIKVTNALQRVLPFDAKIGLDVAFHLLTETPEGNDRLAQKLEQIATINAREGRVPFVPDPERDQHLQPIEDLTRIIGSLKGTAFEDPIDLELFERVFAGFPYRAKRQHPIFISEGPILLLRLEDGRWLLTWSGDVDYPQRPLQPSVLEKGMFKAPSSADGMDHPVRYVIYPALEIVATNDVRAQQFIEEQKTVGTFIDGREVAFATDPDGHLYVLNPFSIHAANEKPLDFYTKSQSGKISIFFLSMYGLIAAMHPAWLVLKPLLSSIGFESRLSETLIISALGALVIAGLQRLYHFLSTFKKPSRAFLTAA